MGNNQTTYFTRLSNTKTIAWDQHNVFLRDDFLFELVEKGYDDIVILSPDFGRLSASLDDWLAAEHATTQVRRIPMSRMDRG